jgi:hypothetical protein
VDADPKENAMRFEQKVTWLRVSLWAGAIFDALVLVPMLSPRAASALFGISDQDATPGFRYAMFLGASLMAGWTCLLAWAARAPLERRGVALMTVVPVLGGIGLSGFYAVVSGFIPVKEMLPTFCVQIGLAVTLLGSYLATKRDTPPGPSRARA